MVSCLPSQSLTGPRPGVVRFVWWVLERAIVLLSHQLFKVVDAAVSVFRSWRFRPPPGPVPRVLSLCGRYQQRDRKGRDYKSPDCACYVLTLAVEHG
jgi:hypothetical protein